MSNMPVRKKFFSMTVLGLFIMLLLSSPLIIVWKQVYITNASQQVQVLADSIVTLKKETARLKLTVERLSSRQRIEAIARDNLSLEYPPSERIVIVRPPSRHARLRLPSWPQWRLLAVLRKSLSGERS